MVVLGSVSASNWTAAAMPGSERQPLVSTGVKTEQQQEMSASRHNRNASLLCSASQFPRSSASLAGMSTYLPVYLFTIGRWAHQPAPPMVSLLVLSATSTAAAAAAVSSIPQWIAYSV